VLIDKKLIIEAKEKLGDKSASIIAENLGVKNWDEINLKGSCPFGHIDETPSFIWNPKANSFHCFSCGRNYSIIDHYIEFYHLTFLGAIQRLFKETDIKYYFGEQGVKTERDYKYPFYDMTEDRSDVEEYLRLRGITSKTLDWADIQQDAHKNIVFNYYDNNDVLSLVKYRPSRKVAKGENKMWCQKNSDTIPLLFNMNRVNTANGALLLTEGETDCLSAIEAGYTNSVSVPFGSNNFGWIQTNWDWLEEFDKIIVWSDSDKPGQEMRREVCARLGIWRTLFVDAPTKVLNKDGEEVSVKDINEILYYCGKQKVLDLINDAKELPITGIEDLSSVEDFNIELAPGLYLNLEPIDNTVYKLLFGSVVLVTGKRDRKSVV
jgi:twinkle protein